jgi:HEAT repeat protein
VTNQRWRDIAVAGHLGDESIARAALNDNDAVVRELAIGALHRMDALDDHALLRAMCDPDPGVRRRVALIAGTRPGYSLLPLLTDVDTTVVEAAAWACGEQVDVDETVFAQLLSLAGDADDPLVREAAVAALGAIGDERGLPAILRAGNDKPAVRRRAALALAPFDGPEVADALQRALTDRDWQVRQAAEDVLRAMSD